MRILQPYQPMVRPLRDVLSRLMVLLALSAVSGVSLKAQTIYAVVLGNQNFVVGSSTLHSGLFISTDGAETWRQLGPRNLKAYAMDAVDSEKGRVLYIAAGNGIHRSGDFGERWEIITGWQMTEVLDIKVDQQNPDRIHAATAFGYRRSTDGGETWTAPEGALATEYCYRVNHDPLSGIWYICGENMIYRSSDDGNTWETYLALPAPRQVLPLGEGRNGMATDQGFMVVAALSLDQSMTLGPGESKRMTISPPSPDVPSPFDEAPRMPTYDAALNPGKTLVIAGENGVWEYDLGRENATWTNISDGLPIQPVHAVAFPRPGILLAGTFGEGLFKRQENQWQSVGLAGAQVWRLVVRDWTVDVQKNGEAE